MIVKILKYILSCTSILLIYSCGPRAREEADDPRTEAIPVEVLVLAERNVPQFLNITSTLSAGEEQRIAAHTGGMIERIMVSEGDQVQQGDLLVQMDDTQLQQARIQLETARREYQRMETLYRAGAVSLQQLEAARDQLQNAQTNYNLTQRNTRIRAPFAGTITAVHMNEGEIFTMSPTAAGPPAILTLQQLRTVQATINLSEFYYPQIEEGMTAEITTDVYPERRFIGRVSRIFPTIEPGTRTFPVEISIENQDMVLRPGMFVRIKLQLGIGEGMMAPKSALVRQPGTQTFYVFKVEENQAVRTVVEAGTDMNEWVQIVSGLNKGDTIVTTGQGRLQDGSQVNIVSEFNAQEAGK
jgi:membrane fusion protein, multidrug efflux system